VLEQMPGGVESLTEGATRTKNKNKVKAKFVAQSRLLPILASICHRAEWGH
jgi:hypothetical protein